MIAVIVPCAEGFRTTTSRPRSTESGVYLPSTFLDFGETWRQAAARVVGLSSADLQFRSFESMSLDDSVTHIFALVERGAELIDEGQGTQSPDDLTCPHQQAVIKDWLKSEC